MNFHIKEHGQGRLLRRSKMWAKNIRKWCNPSESSREEYCRQRKQSRDTVPEVDVCLPACYVWRRKRIPCNENRINIEEESDGQGDQKGIRGKLWGPLAAAWQNILVAQNNLFLCLVFCYNYYNSFFHSLIWFAS